MSGPTGGARESPSAAGRGLRAAFAVGGIVATSAGLDTVLRGARSISGSPRADATVESELGFYSAFYVAYGLALLRTAPEADKDSVAVRRHAGALFAGGAARAVAWRRSGKPNAVQRALLAIELAAPVIVVALDMRSRQ